MSDESTFPDWSNADLAPLALVVGWRTSAESTKVQRVPTNRDVADSLALGCRAAVNRLHASEPRVWTAESASEAEEYLYVKRDKLDSGSALIDSLSAATYDVMSAAELPQKSLLFYAMITGTGGRRLVFLRKQNPKRATDRRTITFFSNRLEKIEAVWPVVPGGEKTLRTLVKELMAGSRVIRERVRYQLRGSYTHYYRRMLGPVLAALRFKCNNTAYRPVMDAIDLLAGYASVDEHPR